MDTSTTLTQTIQPFLTLVENNQFNDLDIQQFFEVVSTFKSVPKNELNDAASALMNAIVVSAYICDLTLINYRKTLTLKTD